MAAPLGICIAEGDYWDEPSPTWTRIDTSYSVQEWTIDRGRSFELDKIQAGVASFSLIDSSGDWDPTNAATFSTVVGRQAAIAVQNPVDSAWATVFRGFVARVEWVPYTTLGFANVRVDLVDVLGRLTATEMVPDGNWGDQVVSGNIVFDADTGTDAVNTRMNTLLDQVGFPVNRTGTDAVANGTSTVTSASASFVAADVGQFIKLDSRSRYEIMVINSGTSIEVRGAPSAGTALAWTLGMRALNSGNVQMLAATYAPRTTVMTAIMDCSDAEHPAVGAFFSSCSGQMTFRGRLARFNPTSVQYEIQTWSVGDQTAVTASPSTVVPVAPPFVTSTDDSALYTSAVALHQGVGDGDIPAQYVEATTGSPSPKTKYGLRTWSAENLLTGGGAVAGALAETKKFATYVRDNYSEPQVRVGSLVIRPQAPAGSSGTVTWALICGTTTAGPVDITDRVLVTTTHGGGGGFADYFFVEGVHYSARPMSASVHEITVTLDVSPASHYTTNPF